jgi:hypothetical protein
MSEWTTKKIKFAEMSDELQKKAIEYIRDYDYDLLEPPYDWYEDILENYVEIYKQEGFELNKSDCEFDLYRNNFKFPCSYTKNDYPTNDLIEFLIETEYLDSNIFSETLEFINYELDNNTDDLYDLLDFDEESFLNNLENVIDYHTLSNKKEIVYIMILLDYKFKKNFDNLLKYKDKIMEMKKTISKLFFKDYIDLLNLFHLEDANVDVVDSSDVEEELKSRLNEYVEDIIDNLTPKLEKLYDNLVEDLKKEYEYYGSDEYIRGLLENTDYDFEIECNEDECEIIGCDSGF